MGGSRGGGSAGRKRTWKMRRRGARKRGVQGRQNHPAAGYSHPLDEATDCDGVPPSSTTASSSSCSSAVVVSPSSSPVRSRAISSYFPSLPPTSNLYRTALANLKLGGDASPGMVRAALVAAAVKLETAWISGILFQWLGDIPLWILGPTSTGSSEKWRTSR